MTKRHPLLPLAAAIAVLPLIIGLTSLLAAQDAMDDPGIDVQLGNAELLHRTGIQFPAEARTKHASGMVVATLALDAKGEVVEAHVMSGPEEFRRSVVRSTLGWHFANPSGAARTVEVAIHFDGTREAPTALTVSGAPNLLETPQKIAAVNYSVPKALQDRIAQLSLFQVGDVLDQEHLAAAKTALAGLDEHLTLMVAKRGDGVATLVRLSKPAGTAYDATPAPQSIRVGGDLQANNLIYKVNPKYPPMAKQARIQGTVKMNATIGADGAIQNLQVVSGHPMLVQAAVEAVREWVYKPTLLNGNPVTVITTIDVNFTLTE